MNAANRLSRSDVMMTEIHKTLLITCREELVKNIDPEGILNKLISRKALTKHDAENIRSKQTRTSKVEELLDIIDLKPDRAFTDLINSLIDAGQKHLAKLLTATADAPSMADANNETSFSSHAQPEIQGYVNIGLTDTPVPPPPVDEIEDPRNESQANSIAVPDIQILSEAEVRSALVVHCGRKCCYGSRAAQEMVISNLAYSSAYHYILESFCESRFIRWAFDPYGGEPLDGPISGPAPSPWDIDLCAKKSFEDETLPMEVPHTANVQTCHKCVGIGRLKCHRCHGTGQLDCSLCNGTGRKDDEMCTLCQGSGQERCDTCQGHGHVQCGVCEGKLKVKWYIKLTVFWKNHKDEYISKKTSMPDKKIRHVQGQTVFEKEATRVLPITQCPEPSVNKEAAILVARHRKNFTAERVLRQRQRIRVVPVTEVVASWKNKPFTFFVHGDDRKVYSSNYPQACCCCCGCPIV